MKCKSRLLALATFLGLGGAYLIDFNKPILGIGLMILAFVALIPLVISIHKTSKDNHKCPQCGREL